MITLESDCTVHHMQIFCCCRIHSDADDSTHQPQWIWIINWNRLIFSRMHKGGLRGMNSLAYKLKYKWWAVVEDGRRKRAIDLWKQQFTKVIWWFNSWRWRRKAPSRQSINLIEQGPSFEFNCVSSLDVSHIRERQLFSSDHYPPWKGTSIIGSRVSHSAWLCVS